MNNNEYSLSVSQFAKLCGTTRDTLRHYHNMGILIPHTNESNGYHYYTASQASSFYFINSFRRTGCSVSEIADMIHNTNSHQVHDVLVKQMASLKTELNILSQQIDSLAIILKILDYHEKYDVKTPSVYTIPKISVFKTNITCKDSAKSLANVADDVRKHVEYINTHTHLPPYPIGASISLEDLRSHNYVYNNIITLTASKSVRKKIIPLPSDKVVGCFHEDSSTDITCTYDLILKYIDNNKLTPLSDLFSISIFNIYNEENEHSYLKCLFVCIK